MSPHKPEGETTSERQSFKEVAARFGLPEQWAMMHIGEHRCVDGRIYRATCLVTDPTCDTVARSYMRLIEERANDWH